MCAAIVAEQHAAHNYVHKSVPDARSIQRNTAPVAAADARDLALLGAFARQSSHAKAVFVIIIVVIVVIIVVVVIVVALVAVDGIANLCVLRTAIRAKLVVVVVDIDDVIAVVGVRQQQRGSDRNRSQRIKWR